MSENSVIFDQCWQCKTPLAWLSGECVDEDSLSTQEMADIEDGKPVLWDELRHKRHVCHEVEDVAGKTERKRC
jgi:hypothetical protein